MRTHAILQFYYLKGMMPRLVFLVCVALCSAPGFSQDIFDAGLLHIRIEIPFENWRDTLTSLKQRNSKNGLQSDVYIDGQVYQGVEVRFKGNSSFYGAVKTNLRKLPFRLKAAKGERFDGGYKTLKLSNNFRDPSYVRELLAYRIIGSYMHVPRTLPAVVSVNGEYLGVYTVTEGIEKPMIERVFNDDKGILYECEPDFSGHTPPHCPKGNFSSLEYLGPDTDCYRHLYAIEDDHEWPYLIELAEQLQSSAGLEETLAVHEVLWMHALNNVLVNLDSYLGLFCHNYYLFRDSTGVFHPLMWDMNLAFGGFHALKQGVSVDLAELSPIVHDKYKLTDRPLLYNLLQNEEYRHIYYSCMRTVVEDWFLNKAYLDTARVMQGLVDPWVKEEQHSQYTYPEFHNSLLHTVKKADKRSVLGIGELMSQRVAYLMRHPLIGGIYRPEISWELSGSSSGSHVLVRTPQDVTGVRAYYMPVGASDFTSITMEPSALMADGGKNWQASLPIVARIYFVVKTEDGAGLYPSAAPFRAFHVESEDM